MTEPVYNPKDWVPLEEVTSAGMDNLEAGVQLALLRALNAQTTADAALGAANAANTGGLAGGVTLWSFPGSTPDAKLTNALSYVGAQTVTTPPILVTSSPGSSSAISFSQTGRMLFSGLKFINPFGFGNQQRGAESIPTDVRFTGSGDWWVLPAGQTFDVQFSGIGFQGNSSSTFLASPNGGVLWTSVLRDCGWVNWKSVLGKKTQKLLVTAVLFDGWWNINNSYDTAISIGGSDCNLWMNGMLIDSPPQFIHTYNPGSYHMRLDYLEKSQVGPIYMTSESSGGLLILGGDTTAGTVLCGAGRVEGRNGSQPAHGSCIRIDGSRMTIRDWWVGYGATALNSNGRSGELGLITQTGGHVLYDGIYVDRASGQAEGSFNAIGVTGGTARVRNMRVGTKGGSWSGVPRVDQAGGTVDADNSVSVV